MRKKIKNLKNFSYKTLFICLLLLPFATHAEKVGDVIKSGNTALMLVNILNTPEKNEAFQRDVEIVMRQARLIDFVREKMDEAKDEEEKSRISAKLKQMEDEFNVNNQTMVRLYNFAADRKFRLVFLESFICAPITDDEMSNLRLADGTEMDPLRIVQHNKKNVYQLTKITGLQENEELRRFLTYSIGKKGEIEKMRAEIANTTDPETQMEISSKLAALEKAIRDNENQLREKYNIAGHSSYIIQTAISKLYILLTPEELMKLEAQAQMNSSAAPAQKADSAN